MTQLDAVWQLARSDYDLSSKGGAEDMFLWEHCERVAKLSLELATIIGARKRPPDRFAIAASSLYHNVAWAVLVNEDGQYAAHVLMKPLTATQRELSVATMKKTLRGVLAKESLSRAETAILSLKDRHHESYEGMILADSEELERFSLSSLWSCARKGMIDGRGLQAHIDTWHRRKEYHYWSAKLSDGFFFEETKSLAKRRLESYQRFMDMLEKQLNLQDLSIPDGASEETVNLPRCQKLVPPTE